jgi:hypothetical protein
MFLTVTAFQDPKVSGASIARLTNLCFHNVVITCCMELSRCSLKAKSVKWCTRWKGQADT